jgi:type IV secretion system protein VirD4
VLNQIGRRLTEKLDTGERRHRLLLMLDEFPALGRLDFFESALAFMAGYGLKAFLIAQSLNQIEKAYGPNNAILDNCHVRVAFATNDERTARRVSDALGTTTELRAMNNYAGHRLSPWLGHIMVSRQETARPLLTPGEVMQLPPGDQLILVSGIPPIRARKARYYEDQRLASRILAPPVLTPPSTDHSGGRPVTRANDRTPLLDRNPDAAIVDESTAGSLVGHDRTNGGIRREPGLPGHEAVVPEEPKRDSEIAGFADDPEDETIVAKEMDRKLRSVARQAALDRGDGLGM